MILWCLGDIVPPLADEVMEEIKEQARKAHQPEPEIDRNYVIAMVKFSLQFSSISSIILWATLGSYSVYIIHSLFIWYRLVIRC